MQQFDFMTDRSAHFSVKYDVARQVGDENTLPFWVADMDLPVAEPIVRAIKERASHPYYGYTSVNPDFFTSFAQWHEKRHLVPMDAERLVSAQNVVQAILHVLALDSRPGDAVVVQPPVYFPFFSIIEKLGLKRINNPLQLINGRYEIDFADLERKFKEEDVQYIIFCSPHNPVGRVWSKDELTRLVDLCDAYNVHILSDEIHSDLVHRGTHIPLHTLNDKARAITTSFYSSGKTFNLAAMHSAYIYTRHDKEKDAYLAFEERWEVPLNQLFGMVANIAAFREGEEWYQEMMAYIQGNIDFCRRFVQERLAPIRLIEPESTFLLWLDCRALALTQKELRHFFLKEANILLNCGESFGKEGIGFMRWNIATPRKRLEEGLERVERALKRRKRG